MKNEPFHTKYRPQELKDVIGQDPVVASLSKTLTGRAVPHAFLFTGPSGCGKTTLARIIGTELDCEVIEVDAATNTGIDSMREILDSLRYAAFGNKKNRMVIIDECHSLSKAAWQSMLKAIEEPPEHVYFSLCTTESSKVPATIVTRCASYQLVSVRRADLFDLLNMVCRAEKIDPPDDIVRAAVEYADGSPRKALMGLSMVHDLDSLDEAQEVLSQHVSDREVIELCRLLIDRSLTWEKAMKVIAGLKDENPESIRLVIVNYVTSVLLNSKSKEAPRLLDVLGQFQQPCNSSEKFAPIVLAIGNLLFPSGG